MNSFALVNGTILRTNGARAQDQAVIVTDGKISSIVDEKAVPSGIDLVDLNGDLLSPGFVDLQVNGGGGVLFNDAPTVETIRKIAEAHFQFGTTAFLPTLISDDLDKIGAAYLAVNEAIAASVPGVVGVHIEGPFLNAHRKGIHDDEKIRRLDDAGIDVMLVNRPDITLMTLAPECASLAQIETLTAAGLLLCAGHTEATYQQLRSAFDAGVVGVTHLFNAMSPLTVREPGAVGAALAHADCWCPMIVDGVHVHPMNFQFAIKAKGSLDRFILVTDAMPTVGQQDKSFTLNGHPISVRDGVCQNGDGTLAGSDLDMATAVVNASTLLGLSQSEAIALATINPARMLGLDDRLGAISVGLDASLVQIDDHGAVQRTWICGDLVWAKAALQ